MKNLTLGGRGAKFSEKSLIIALQVLVLQCTEHPLGCSLFKATQKSSDIALQVIAYGALTTGGTPSGGLSLDISQKKKVGRMKF